MGDIWKVQSVLPLIPSPSPSGLCLASGRQFGGFPLPLSPGFPCLPLQPQERESLNAGIVDAINQAADDWGIQCLRYEIKNIHVPPRVKESMQMQVSPCARRCWSQS